MSFNRKRQIAMGVGAGIVLTVLFGSIKYFQISAAIAEQMAMQQPPTAVTTTVARAQVWDQKVRAVGTVSAVQGATLSAELAGTVREIFFKSGELVEEGTKLVQLDVRVESANLEGARAMADEAEKMLARARILRKKNANSISDLDAAIARAADAKARVLALENTIARKTISAPFSGYTGIRRVNLGEYVTDGQAIVPLFSLDELFIDFTLPQKDLARVSKGAAVTVVHAESGYSVTGVISSLDPNVDRKTRNFAIQARISNPGEKLRPGMFVSVAVATGASEEVIPIPQSSVVYAPYGNSVWVLDESKEEGAPRSISQQFVKLGSTRGDLVAVTSGLNEGMELVTSGGFKLRPGLQVVVNNSVTPTEAENPTPPNT